MKQGNRIILLAGKSNSTNYLYNALSAEFEIVAVVQEDKISTKKFLSNRLRKLGLVEVIGQILFQLSILPILKVTSSSRIKEIETKYNLSNSPIPIELIKNVKSVNSNECIDFLLKSNPDIILVNGTRIISNKVLSKINCNFINIHAGITPKFRGVHGGYWALATKNKKYCGVTVHLVDKGIDTGSVLGQVVIEPIKTDNFVTYPIIQQSEGIILLKQILNNFFKNNNTLKTIPPLTLENSLYYHPTIFYYLSRWVVDGIK